MELVTLTKKKIEAMDTGDCLFETIIDADDFLEARSVVKEILEDLENNSRASYSYIDVPRSQNTETGVASQIFVWRDA